MQRALSAGDLARVRAQVPDEDAGNKAQQVVVYAHACVLETNSAGLSILFDRFSRAERRSMASALAAIKATATLRALRSLERAFARKKAPETGSVDRRSDKLVAEMEARLLRFCEANVEELAAG